MLTENNKRIVKNTSLLYIRMTVVMLLNLYISRVILEVLGIEDYGIYNIVGGVVAMFAYLNSALTASTQRFLNYEMGKTHTITLNRVFSMSFTIHLILAVIVLLFSETIGLWFLNEHIVIPDNRIYAANWVFQLSIISTIITIIIVPYYALIIAHERISVIAYISIIEVLLKVTFVLVLKLTAFDNLIEYASYILIITFITRFLYVLFCLIKYRESKYHAFWDKSLFIEMFKFTGWNFMGATAGIAMNQGVNILLNIFGGPIINAARAIAIQIQHAFAQLATNFTTAVNPQIVKSYSSGDIKRMTDLVIASSKYSFLIMAVTTMPFIVKMDFILNIWLTDVPNYASSFTILILLYQLSLCLTYSINMASQASGNIRLFQIVESSTLLLIIPIGWIQLKIGLAPTTVFVAMIILSLITLFLRLLVLKRIINFAINRYIKEVFYPVAMVSFLFAVMYYISVNYFTECNNFLINITQMAIILFIAFIAACVVGFNHREKIMIFEYIKTYIQK